MRSALAALVWPMQHCAGCGRRKEASHLSVTLHHNTIVPFLEMRRVTRLLTLVITNASFGWALQMHASDGRCKCMLRMDVADGHCGWTLRMDIVDGRYRWTLRVDVAHGHKSERYGWTLRMNVAVGRWGWTLRMDLRADLRVDDIPTEVVVDRYRTR